jgi:hypothetical protein
MNGPIRVVFATLESAVLALATRRVKADMARRWVEVYKAQKTR